MKPILLKSILPITTILVWHIFSVSGMNASEILPGPIKVISAVLILFTKESVLTDVLVSLKHVAIGFALATLGGVIVGILSGYSKTIKMIIGPILEFLRPIPPISWIPLSILWFGIGDNPAYFLVFLGAFFPIMSNVYFGVISVEENHKRAALSLGAGRKEHLFDIILPAALPSIFTGLKTGLGISWFMVITAELVGSQSGLGYMIQMNRLLLQTDRVIGGMVIIGVLGYLMSKIMTCSERKLIPWRVTS
jgi:ABC-type nitrate/sulfonate/bicarbonate transport system permease component